MKKIIIIVVLNLLFINCNAQQTVNIDDFNIGDNSNKYFKDIHNNYAKYVGTWENTTGDITFQLNLWKDERRFIGFFGDPNSYMDHIFGNYKIIKYKGTPNEIILHDSVRTNAITNVSQLNVFYLTADSLSAEGTVSDNCAFDPRAQSRTTLTGYAKMIITNPGISPSIAHWTVKSLDKGGLFGETFTIPQDIIMTKM